MSQLRIGYDDQLHDVLDKVNAALTPHGLRFEDDDQERDGFTVHELKRTAADAEVTRLQGIIDGLAARVAAQSELLSRRAEESR